MTESELLYELSTLRGNAARIWHLTVAIAALAVSGGLFLIPAEGVQWPAGAILVLAVPALIGAAVLHGASTKAASWVTALWAVAAAIAAASTGGLSSPLLSLVLVPLILSWLISGSSRLALGAVYSLLAVLAVAFAGQVNLVGPMAPASWVMGLGPLSLSIVASSLITAVFVSQRYFQQKSELAESETSWLERLLHTSPDMVLTLARDGRVTGIFGAALPGLDQADLRINGLAACAEVSDRERITSLVTDPVPEVTQTVRFAPFGMPASCYEGRVRRFDDLGTVITVRDASIDHAREFGLEQARAEAETLASSRSRFLANMSHELRTPLNAIMGFSDVMRNSLFGPLSKRYAEYAELIHESGSHLLEMIGEVLDVSKIEAERYELDRETFDAREAVSSALRMMRLEAEKADIKMRGLLPTEDLEVSADRRALRQIVLNLVSNALKFTGTGGSVTVELNAYDGMMELAVVDTGVGVAPEDLERLGKPYQQAGDAGRRAQGTGLGLSLVSSLAKLHGGHMTIDSVLGEGTTVTVRIPVLVHPELYPVVDGTWGGNVVAFTPQR